MTSAPLTSRCAASTRRALPHCAFDGPKNKSVEAGTKRTHLLCSVKHSSRRERAGTKSVLQRSTLGPCSNGCERFQEPTTQRLLSGQHVKLYEKLAGDIEVTIRKGVFRPGDRIPSVRQSSQHHQLSITTVIRAYLLLESKGVIESRPQSGYFVRLLDAKSEGKAQELRTSRPIAAHDWRRPRKPCVESAARKS